MITKSLLVAALVLPLAAQAQSVGTFTDGNQSPATLSWLTRSTQNITGSAVDDALVLTRNTSNSGNVLALSYFTPATARQLAIGETLTVSGSIIYSNGASGSAYVGLFNSAPETRLSGNSTGSSEHTSFDTPGAYHGYQSYYAVTSGAGGHSIDQRSATKAFTSTTLVGAGNVEDLVSATGGSGTTMTFSLSVERTAADTVEISSVYNDNVANLLTYTDSIGATFSFDTLAFFFGNTSLASNGSTITLDNVSIVTSAIPEPSSYALLAGAAILGLTGTSRRRR